MNTDNIKRKDATRATKLANKAVYEKLPFNDTRSFELAGKNLLKPIPPDPIYIYNDNKVVWNPERFNFVGGEAPETVNPSLWRQSSLTNIGGLFEVIPGIYQVRNYDLANMTIIETKDKKGIILADVLTCKETAEASFKLYYDWKGEELPVIAVIITHSHADHFSGLINKYIKEDDIKNGTITVYAPESIMDHIYMENLYMGNFMGRRAGYMYGNLLPGDPKGDVGAGLGSIMATGSITMTEHIKCIKLNESVKSIGDLEFEFMLTPDTEAPAEMHFYIPYYKALCPAENANHTMHNVYSLRGAQVRDALAWSKDLNKTLALWGDKAEVCFGVHHWPVWENDKVVDYLKKQRDCYRYIHDQTVRLINMGYKPVEIAEILKELPPVLENDWDLRGYYGSLNHNIKSVYVKHIGWFDGNPAELHKLPPSKAGVKYVEFMGGAEELIRKARQSFEKGEYRWTAEVLNHLVFSDPHNTEARELQADTLEQLGYQAESGPWRNFYLTAAMELRMGVNKKNVTLARQVPLEDFVLSCPYDIFFDYMGMLLRGPDVMNEKAVINITFDSPDTEKYQLVMENGVLNHTDLSKLPGNQGGEADVFIKTSRAGFYNLVTDIAISGQSVPETLQTVINSGTLEITGKNVWKFQHLLEHLEVLDKFFNIIEPVSPAM